MPKIHLKPHSPEYADSARSAPSVRACDTPGCRATGEHKAPKSRDSNDYFWFCLEHVQDYNKAWDYFSGMSHDQVEEHIVRSALWDRPTRRFHSYADLKEELHRKAWQTYAGNEKPKERASSRSAGIDRNAPEYEAMAILGVEPPLDLAMLKERYRQLVKKYHPDVNPDEPEAEAILKSVNMAYTLLKVAYEKYAAIEDKP